MRVINYILIACFLLLGLTPVPFLNRIRTTPMLALVLKQTLINPVPGASVYYGNSVAISEDGTYVLVACWRCTASSVAQTGFVENWKKGAGDSWTKVNTIPASVTGEQFGNIMAMSGDGNYAAITGEVQKRIYIYKRNGDVWELKQSFRSPAYLPGVPFVNEQNSIHFNYDATYLVVGAATEIQGSDQVGRVYVYYRQPANSTYDSTPIASITNPKPQQVNRLFGAGVGISTTGDWIIVGSPNEDNELGINAGNAYIYRRTGTTTINTSGQEMDPWSGSCGYGVRISNSRALVTCYLADNTINYRFNGTTWVENSYFDGGYGIDSSGVSYHINYNDDYIFVFVENRGVYTKGPNTTITGGHLMARISFNGKYVVVGNENDDTGATDSGKAYIYKLE